MLRAGLHEGAPYRHAKKLLTFLPRHRSESHEISARHVSKQ
jgi:hypothetical protein